MSRLLAKIQSSARRLGVEIRRSSTSSRPDIRLVRFLSQFEISDIIDVGANEGQFATSVFEGGYAGRILSIEPQPDICKMLQQKAARLYDGRWKVADALALSDTEAHVEFHVTQSRAASSMLKPDVEAARRVSQIVPVKTIRVQSVTLDSLMVVNRIDARSAFLKIDVQGAEKKVLDGATSTLVGLRGALIELSTTSLYQSQPLFPEILAFMTNAGFALWDIDPGFRNAKTGRMEQCDATFVRASLV